MRQNEIIKNIPDVPTDRLVYMYVIYAWWLQVVDRALNILPTSRSPRGGVANSLGSNCIAFSEDCFTAESSMQQCRSPQNPIKTIARLDGFLSPENLILVTGVGLPLLSPSLCAASARFAKTPMNVVIHCHPLGSAAIATARPHHLRLRLLRLDGRRDDDDCFLITRWTLCCQRTWPRLANVIISAADANAWLWNSGLYSAYWTVKTIKPNAYERSWGLFFKSRSLIFIKKFFMKLSSRNKKMEIIRYCREHCSCKIWSIILFRPPDDRQTVLCFTAKLFCHSDSNLSLADRFSVKSI